MLHVDVGAVPRWSPTDELALHTHVININVGGNHQHGIKRWMGFTNNTSEQKSEGTGTGYYKGAQANTTTTELAGNHTHVATAKNTGTNLAHENRQPYIVINRFRRVG